MTLTDITALFVAMLVLAAVPGLSVLTVTARTVTGGISHGTATAAGVVVGDLVFILLALFGLAVLAETLGERFYLIKYLGGAYLIWLGTLLWRANNRTAIRELAGNGSLISSFLAGLLVTLGDQKAIFFYLGFFPLLWISDLSHPWTLFRLLLSPSSPSAALNSPMSGQLYEPAHCSRRVRPG